MKGYAYISKDGMFHIVEDEVTAKEYAMSKIIETDDVVYNTGYPTAGNIDSHIKINVKEKTVSIDKKEIKWEDIKDRFPTVYKLLQQFI